MNRFDLDDGTTVWVVWHERDLPKIEAGPAAAGHFFRGKSAADIGGDGLRIIAFSDTPDGWRLMYECPVNPAPNAVSYTNAGN